MLRIRIDSRIAQAFFELLKSRRLKPVSHRLEFRLSFSRELSSLHQGDDSCPQSQYRMSQLKTGCSPRCRSTSMNDCTLICSRLSFLSVKLSMNLADSWIMSSSLPTQSCLCSTLWKTAPALKWV